MVQKLILLFAPARPTPYSRFASVVMHGCPMYLDMLDEPDFSTLDSHLRTPFADVNMDDTMGA